MKKLSYFLFSCVLLSACLKTNPTPQQPKVSTEVFSCKVNGQNWEAVPKNLNGQFATNDLSVSLWVPPHAIKDTGIYINAYNRAKGEAMSVGFPFYIGKFNVKNTFKEALFGPGLSCNIDTLKPNIVTILSHDKVKQRIKGIFHIPLNKKE